jgi:hypothetical protein
VPPVGAPRTQQAAELARRVGRDHGEVAAVTRFPTGLCHYVFDVELADGARVVVRVADPEQRHLLLGALAWEALLRPLGVPLPAVLAHDVRPQAPLPYLVLERLPGQDLGLVHAALTPAQRRALAVSVVAVQRAVHRLGPGTGYGSSADPSARPPRATWTEVVRDHLRRSDERLVAGPPDTRGLTARVAGLLVRCGPYLDAVRPVPFLDDTTTKNVIVHEGRLAGVVDVDVLCFGDPLWTPALTRVSLVAAGQTTEYVDAWLEALAPDGPALAAFDLYCAAFCLDLLSERGLAFNREEPVVLDDARTGRLLDEAARLLR